MADQHTAGFQHPVDVAHRRRQLEDVLAGAAIIDDIEAAHERGGERGREVLHQARALVIAEIHRLDGIEAEAAKEGLGIDRVGVCQIVSGGAGKMPGEGFVEQIGAGTATRADPALSAQHDESTGKIIQPSRFDQPCGKSIGDRYGYILPQRVLEQNHSQRDPGKDCPNRFGFSEQRRIFLPYMQGAGAAASIRAASGRPPRTGRRGPRSSRS